METTVFRTFVGLNNGNPLFYDDSMGCPVMYGSCWRFYRV